ncbi:MAG: hypothetical protein A3F72_05075 [Bacteroidetes bacterium RIFCSPLOWO2_12_FULL_35_15]|nr:MAG: hypothetical protein A3F72_05075 [Bacteroidetes bacterium RIFCSPLOWO2_12_FULL_35_15]
MEKINRENKLRILFLITDLGKGGAERYLIDLCTELLNYHEIEFIIGSLYDNNQYVQLSHKFKIVNLNFQTFSLRKKNENPEYKKLVQEFKPHIIHSHRFLGEFLSSYYINPKIKYVCHFHDNMIQLEKPKVKNLLNKEKLIFALERNHLIKNKYKKAPSFFIANSTHTESFCNKNIPTYLKNNIRLIPYGFNYYRFKSEQAKIIDTSKAINILNVGSFQSKKNQIFIIEIAKILKKRELNFIINLIGEGEQFENVKNAIEQNKLQNNIILTGNINDVENWYKKVDIYIHTAKYEPFGLVFLEAMASGTPIITLDGKGNRDLIENGKNGFIINEENPEMFADKIELLISNKSLYHSISEYAIEYSKKYDIKNKTKELIDFYYQIREKVN